MSFFEDASLVLIPSAQKTSKVYSVKPTDGTGDFTFTRSNDTATRVASNGLIEKVRTNLITYSQAFDNAAWTKGGVGTYTSAITTGFTDPTGGTNAQRWLATIASVSDRAFVRQLATLTNGIPYAISFWVKSNTGSSQDIYFMFQGGAVQATTATTSWQRISYSATTSTTSVLVGIEAKDLAIDVLVYGFQLEVGDVVTDYIATTTAAVSVGPVANVPRLDYLNSSCPRLLLEPQRTNLALYSEQFNNAYWLNSGLSLSANSVTSPDGYVNADMATETATTSQHGLSSGVISFTSGTTYTFSAFAKNAPSGRGFIQLYGFQLGSAAANVFANFDLNTGVVGSLSGGTSTITNYGNGWYRCTFTFACGNSLSERINLFNVTSASATAGLSYTGDITKAIYWYGAQVEASYATSYINTLNSAVTRGADACSKTGISSLIGQTEGTLYAEFTYNGVANSGVYEVILVVGTDTNNLIALNKNNTTSELYAYSINGGVIQVNSVGIAGTNILGTHKVALAYKLNDYAVYLDGVQVFTDTSATVPACSGLYVGQSEILTQQLGGTINQSIIFPTRLSNADLAALTA